jgi:preprotein translocase subunit SecF
VEDAGFAGAAIQGFGGEREYLVRLQTFEEVGGEGEVERMLDALSAAYGEEGYTVLRVEAVGPKVGSELQRKAVLAILMSFVLTLIYLAFRFEWRFGVAAVVATIHDIMITFGFISLMGIEITLGTVAAILTIVGYSLNDTIVVFDRIRENLRKKRKEPYETTLNRSINETLPRTVLTSGTTLVTLLALFIFGGSVIRPFAMVLILGVLIGTYSSIFVASPALLEIEEYGRRRAKAQRAHAAGA